MKYIITIIIALTTLTANAQYNTHALYATDTTFTETTYDSNNNYLEIEQITFYSDSTYYVIVKGYTYKEEAAYQTDISNTRKTQNETLDDAYNQEQIIEIIEEVLDAKQNEPPQ